MIAARYPFSEHHLMYSGEGDAGGNLFDGQMRRADAGALLGHWSDILGRSLGIVEMDGLNNKGAVKDLHHFCTHSSYYIASDLPNGGYSIDGTPGTPARSAKFSETDPATQYHRWFAEHADLGAVLRERIDLRRKLYEYSRGNMVEDKVEQANYLYDCAEAMTFVAEVEAFLDPEHETRSQDLRDYLEMNGAGQDLLDGFDRTIRHRTDNRDFFDWEVTANGILCQDCR